MKNSHAYIFILVMVILVFSVVPIAKILIVQTPEPIKFVTSTYSKYCYIEGTENKNIKVKKFYKTLESCGKPMKQ